MWSLHRDSEGVLWVATEHGLNRVENERRFAFFQRHGLPENQISQIVEDSAGQFWCGTERGIFRASRADLNRVAHAGQGEVPCAIYEESDGMLSRETNGQKSSPAGIRAPDGRLWFATARGAVGFDPIRLREAEVPPIASVDRIRVQGRTAFSELPLDSNEAHASRPPRINNALQLPPGSGQAVEIGFTGHSLTAPDRLRFRYRLHGFETNWVETRSRREAFYTNLRPGRYRFEVFAAARHGLWSPSPATVAFEIQPFLRETLSFRVAVGLGIAVLAATLWLWRTRELQRIHALEAEAALARERQRLASDLHDHVGADLTHLTLLAEVAELRDHPMSAEALRKLSARARAATESLRDTIWATLPDHQNLARLSDRIAALADDLLGAAGIPVRYKAPPQPLSIPLQPEVCRGVYLASKEILHNAVRHSGASQIEIDWETDPDEIRLVVRDNGRGLPSDEKPAPTGSSTGGLGLPGIRRRLLSFGGRLEIHPSSPSGTMVHLTFPRR